MWKFVSILDLKFYSMEQREEISRNWINFYKYLIIQKDKEIIELKEIIEELQ